MKPQQECVIAYVFPDYIYLLPERHPSREIIENLFKKNGIRKHRIWRRKTKEECRHYTETGVLGSYETAGIKDKTLDGKPVPLFEDTELREQPDSFCLERHMDIAGKKFRVSSVFPKVATSLPTDKLLTLIDKELEILSRLGRDYLLVGQYTEMIFPSYGVRFIAVNNNVDSLYGDNDFTPFVNLFNDFYAKDTSRKIRAVVKSKAERGERVGTRAPYGYKKDEANHKSKIVPDEDVTPIVQRIFSLCVEGKGPTQITAERIEELQASISNVTRFIDKARQYTEINELSGELLNVFIEKIEVGERAERYSRTAEQEIVIHYRDIGVVGAFAEEAEKIAEIRQRQTA